FRALAHARQQRREVARCVRLRHVDHMLGHMVILPARFSRRRTSSYGTSFLEDRSARSRASASSRSPSFWSIRRYWFTSSKTASLRPLVPTTNFGAVPIGEIIAPTREAVHAANKRVEVSFGMGSPS